MWRKAVTCAASLVSLSIIMAMPMPQFGWHPQESWPHSAEGPWIRSAQSEKVLGNAESALLLDVVRHVRERIALCEAALVADVLVAAGEADGLEREEANLLG